MDVVTKTLMCPMCQLEQPEACFPAISTCRHQCCQQCFQTYLTTEILESRVVISCPQCPALLNPNDIEKILQDSQLMEEYKVSMLKLAIDPKLSINYCPSCRHNVHPKQTCEEAKAKRLRLLKDIEKEQTKLNNFESEVKLCPQCGISINKVKDSSNRTTCDVCGTQFCWVCMKKIDDLGKMHYYIPTGCPYYSRIPWSRNKNILYSIASLIFLPVVIPTYAVFISLVTVLTFLVTILTFPYYFVYLYVVNITFLLRACCGSTNNKTEINQIDKNNQDPQEIYRIETITKQNSVNSQKS